MNQCSPIAGTHPPKRMLCEITAEGQEARALRGCTEQQDEELTRLYWPTSSVTLERTTGPCMGHSAAATMPTPVALTPMLCMASAHS